MVTLVIHEALVSKLKTYRKGWGCGSSTAVLNKYEVSVLNPRSSKITTHCQGDKPPCCSNKRCHRPPWPTWWRGVGTWGSKQRQLGFQGNGGAFLRGVEQSVNAQHSPPTPFFSLFYLLAVRSDRSYSRSLKSASRSNSTAQITKDLNREQCVVQVHGRSSFY